MKICIYHPNMHFMGGGETVALTIASALSKEHEVTILVTEKIDVKKLEEFFNTNLEKVKFKQFGQHITKLPTLNSLKHSIYIKCAYKFFKNYDLVIDTASNGLFYKKIPQKTICYVHFPNFTKPKKGVKSFLNHFLIKEDRMYVYDEILCNSKFTQKYVNKLTDKKTHVVYPPVRTEMIKPAKKEKKIMTIGRFSPEKKHEIMIKSFIKLEKEHPEYELNIIGAEGDLNYLDLLKKMAKGHKIHFHINIPHKKVLKMLETATIYWHSRGYGEKDPVEYENFGITTVEAMAAGCIPIVINLGAQPEIVTHKKSGYCWNNPEELIKYTKEAINSKENNMIAKQAYYESGKYTEKGFQEQIMKLI